MPFDGETYERARDGKRLQGQLEKVRRFMLRDSGWYTLEEISQALGYPQASISARLRDLRKEKFGSLIVDRRRVPGARGLYEYRVVRGDRKQLGLF